MSKKVFLVFLITLFLSKIVCQSHKKDFMQEELILNRSKAIDNFVLKNIKLPSYADGVLRYFIIFNLNNDSIIKSIWIEDFYKLDCTECEENLEKVFSLDAKWPFELPDECQLPANIKYIITIDLLNYSVDCEE